MRTKEKRVVDLYRVGFALLAEQQHLGAGGGVQYLGDDDPLLAQKFRRFEFWLQGADVRQTPTTHSSTPAMVAGRERGSTAHSF